MSMPPYNCATGVQATACAFDKHQKADACQCTCCSLNTSSTIVWRHAIRVSVQQTRAQSTAEAINKLNQHQPRVTWHSGHSGICHKSNRKAASSRQLLLVLSLKKNVCCFSKHVTVNIGDCVRRARRTCRQQVSTLGLVTYHAHVAP